MRKVLHLGTAAAVTMAITSPALAIDIDGWDFSGQNARNEALQSDYGNLRDSYNIWVNPALVNDYSDRIDVNVSGSGSPNNNPSNDEMGGVYKTFGGQTIGAYIGRPSESALFNTPENQFDLFWGMNLGDGFKIGARLNFQAIDNSGFGNGIFGSDAITQNPNPAAAGLNNTTDISSTNSEDASELNLAFGVAFGPNSAYEATLFLGSPDATTSSYTRNATLNETLDATLLRTGYNSTENTINDNTDSDDSTLGLALRGQFGNWLTTFMYGKTDADSTRVRTDVENIIVDNDNNGVNETDTTDTTVTTIPTTSEETSIRLQATRAYNPTSSTLVALSLGLVTEEMDKTETTQTSLNTFVDRVAGVTTTTASQLNNMTTTSDEALMIPLVIALEGQVNENWTARASIAKNLYQKTETTTMITDYIPGAPPQQVDVVTRSGNESIWSGTDTTVAFGFGYTKSALTVDATLMKEFVTEGVDEGLAGRINVTYLFP